MTTFATVLSVVILLVLAWQIWGSIWNIIAILACSRSNTSDNDLQGVPVSRTSCRFCPISACYGLNQTDHPV